MVDAVRTILMYGLVPLWILAGLGDWWCHRRTAIERNAGLRESAMHSAMMIEVGIPVLMALFLEINAMVFAAMLAGAAVHAITAWIDVAYATDHRTIRPIEQHMHSLLEVLPLAAVALIASVHWEQFLALFGAGPATPDYSLALKAVPLPAAEIAGLLVAILVLVVAPYAEELVRCARYARLARDPRVQRS
ncbi:MULTISPECIES: diguanylate cyclase [unclassified Cupriavidus]|uniref:diguanylate cyclase n=1 Tax=unclassified Cupriavidus TaxID=2640874 RepID=UPI00313D85FB